MINEEDRVEIVKNIKFVDEVIFPCPLIVSMDFIKMNNIDMVVHGFSNEADKETQKKFFKEIDENGYFKEIEYYKKISTTALIKKMESNK
jgi:choline-phosphate cytidylyltransferase